MKITQMVMILMKRLIGSASIAVCLAAATAASAQNPVVQTNFTTDPAPVVFGDRLYVYTGHDEKGADFFWMQEWRVYSTDDMVNWTDHGSPLAIEDFSWGDDRAWAPQCVERDGKYYFYVPLHSNISGAMAIGVAVGDTPTGPFKDAIGKPLADGDWAYIDPTCFIDDDGQAWLYWGNPQIFYVKLNPDMISFEGEVMRLPMTQEGFGTPAHSEVEKDKVYHSTYTEGPWAFKRDGRYYMIYAAGGIPENISYSMASSPEGPWEYKGVIMPQDNASNSFTNHSGVIDYKGHSYFFYHTGKLPGGGGFGRSMAVEEFKYNPDGTIPEIRMTDEGVRPVGTLDPWRRVEAETIAFSEGLGSRQAEDVGVYISDIHNGDWLKVREVDFGAKSPSGIIASCASGLRGGRIEIHADAPDGPLLANIDVSGTGGWEKWQTFTAPVVTPVTGRHDLWFLFIGRKGPELFNFDHWQFLR